MPLAAKLREPVEEREVAVHVGVSRCSVQSVVLGVHVRADLQQEHRRLCVASRACEMDGRLVLEVSAVHVRAPFDESADAVRVVVLGRYVQGRESILVAGVDLHAVRVQELHHVVPLVLGHDVERRVALPGLAGKLCAPAVAQLRQANVAGTACVLQQRLLSLHVVGIDVRGLQEALEHVHEHRAVPSDDLLQVEGLEFVLRTLEGAFQIREGILDGMQRRLHGAAAGQQPARGGRSPGRTHLRQRPRRPLRQARAPARGRIVSPAPPSER
mmetsp:Transcript_78239/g.253975  ORF Transcript_78239/g.253975 Transcript_78239/m.253975 type:complete len:271 (+) Transcript_78239:330-1142(+)